MSEASRSAKHQQIYQVQSEHPLYLVVFVFKDSHLDASRTEPSSHLNLVLWRANHQWDSYQMNEKRGVGGIGSFAIKKVRK